MAQDALPLNSIAGADTAVVIGDSKANLYRLVPDGTNGFIKFTKNGNVVAIGQVPVAAKTAAYTVLVSDSGAIFTTAGAAGAVTFTLPAVAGAGGCSYRFVNAVGQTMAVTAPTGTLVTFNNAVATTVTFSTAGNLIGASVEVFCDGTLWYARPAGANTMTVS